MSRVRQVVWVGLALSAVLMGPAPAAVLGQPPGGRRGPAAAERPATPEKPATAAAEPLRTAGDRPFDVRDIRLDLRVDLPKKTVEGKATLQVCSLRPIKSIDLDAVGFLVKQVALAGEGQQPTPARFGHDGKRLVVYLASPWPAGHSGTLYVDYRVREPKDGLHFFAPSTTEPDARLCVWSQGEPTSNRYWFPCVDQPDQRQTTQMVVTVPEGFEAVSNGKLLERKENSADKTVTFDWRQDKPHPSYLVTLVVGQFDVVQEEWDKMPVLYYVPKGHKNEVTYTFGRTREMLAHFSQRFGVHYPWDKYAQVVAYRFGGGMENTSATTLGDIMQDQRSTLDNTPDGLIAHELAHQWWGDMVTCRDWAHLWLNEGFASYAEALWDEHHQGPDAYAYNMLRKAEGAITGGKTRPVVDRHYPTPGSMFDGRSYPKGAWVLHMLRHRLGDEAFWKGIQRYGDAHRFQSAETTDFRRTMERTTGHDLERFFYDWTERPGSPVVEVATEYLPAAQQARITIKQTQAAEPFHFPLTVAFDCAGTTQPTVITHDVTDKEHTVIVPLPGPPARADVDPDQALLGEIKETKGHDLWAGQLNSPSLAARVRAIRHFKDSKDDEDRELLAKALAAEKFWGVKTEIAGVLAAMGGAVCREALLAGLNDTNARIRRSCMENLGKFKPDPKIAAAVKEVLDKGDPSYAVTGAAMIAYAKQSGKEAVAVLTPWLAKPSHNDTYRNDALEALGHAHDLAALNTLLTWTEPGHPRRSRVAALRGLVQLAQKTKPSEEQNQQLAKAITRALKSEDTMERFAVIMALPDLGTLATLAVPTLETMSQEEGNERAREMAKRTLERIREKNKSAAGSSPADVTQLRQEVERLQREQAELRERLGKFEKAAAAK